jgi:hypothetical protein
VELFLLFGSLDGSVLATILQIIVDDETFGHEMFSSTIKYDAICKYDIHIVLTINVIVDFSFSCDTFINSERAG